MKNLFIITFFVLATGLISCASKKMTGESQSVQPAGQGLIELTSKGYGSVKSASVVNATENAFKNILIHGIPDSNQERPMLGKNAFTVFEKNHTYFDRFFKNEMSSFVIRQKVLSFNPTHLSQASSEVWLQINLDALRRKLETDGIITTFGL